MEAQCLRTENLVNRVLMAGVMSRARAAAMEEPVKMALTGERAAMVGTAPLAGLAMVAMEVTRRADR